MTNAAFALFGSMGEAKVESLDSEKKFCTSMFHNGVWEKRKTHVGEFTHCIAPITIPYLKESCEASFKWTLPKPPVGIYNEVLRFFREIYNTIKSEVFVGVFWNLEQKKYQLYVPDQEVAGASIKYSRDKGAFVDPNLVHVIDIHSHCNFGAGFSGTDTADEVSTKLFGVIGNILGNVSMAWRAGCNQKFVTMTFDQMFDNESTETFSVGDDAVGRVKEIKRPIFVSPAVVPRVQTGAYPAVSRFNNTPKKWEPPKQAYPNHNFNDSVDYGEDQYINLLMNSQDFDIPFTAGMGFESDYTWADPDYFEAFEDFNTVYKSWLDDVNGSVCSGTSNRQLVSQFFDLVNSCDQMDVDFIKYVLNESINYMTVNEFHDLVQHFSGLL